MPRASSRKTVATENIEAEECQERRAYKVNNLIESRQSGLKTNRSKDRASAAGGDQPVQLFKVKNENRSRAASGSVEGKKRCKSFVSTEQSTPNKGEDYTLTLYTEIHKTLVSEDRI